MARQAWQVRSRRDRAHLGVAGYTSASVNLLLFFTINHLRSTLARVGWEWLGRHGGAGQNTARHIEAGLEGVVRLDWWWHGRQGKASHGKEWHISAGGARRVQAELDKAILGRPDVTGQG